MHTRRDDLRLALVDEDRHQRLRENHRHRADKNAEHSRREKRAPHSAANALRLSRAIILRNERRKRIAKILHRVVGKGVNLHSRCKRRHDHRTKAVDQPLHQQYAKIHHRLLDAREK